APGGPLARTPAYTVVLFAGIYAAGRRIQQLSADHYDRIVAAEMGSKSAVIVCEDARLDLAVTSAVISGFKTSGQRCVSAGRVIVAEEVFERFGEEVVATGERLDGGDPLDPAHCTGPVIHRGAVEKVLGYNELAKKEGAQVLLDGGRMTHGEHSKGCYLSPFVYRMDWRPGVRSIREEVFGPHVALIP